MGLFLDCFGELPDPRRGNARRHDLLELLTIALSATLCGAASCVDFELFARSKEEFLREFLSLEGGVPSQTRSRGCSGCSIRPPSRPA
jgi:DDE_Tnp_1-associated